MLKGIQSLLDLDHDDVSSEPKLNIFDAISPLDFRYYGRNEKIFHKLQPYLSENAMIKYMAYVEAALTKTLAKHNMAYENSGLSIKQYCQENQVNYHSLRNYRYNSGENKPSPNEKRIEEKNRFKMFNVGITIQLSIDSKGNLSLHGIMPEHLPNILKVLNAVP